MAHRTFVDAAKVEWEVWEVYPTLTERRVLGDRRGIRRNTPERRIASVPRIALDRDLRRGWLAFKSSYERRRLTPIPEGWADSTETQLRALLGRSRFSGPVRRLAE
jgi:hypothetical protein